MGKRRRWVLANALRIPVSRTAGIAIRVLNARDASAGLAGVVRVDLPPGRALPEVRHRRTHEWVYVARGPAWARLDGEAVVLRTGTYLYLPPGAWHSFRAGRRPVAALSFFLPPLRGARPDVETREVRHGRPA